MRSVCLIRVPNFLLHAERLQTPLGILYIAGYLREHGVRVTICDLAGEPRHRWEELIPEGFDIFGISLTTGDMTVGCEIGHLIKKLYPNSLLVCGGAHPSALPIKTLSDGPFETVVVGPGEQTMLDLAAGNDLPPGCFVRAGNKVLENPQIRLRRTRLNLENLPLPAWDLIPDVISYNLVEKGEPGTCVMVSMGCTYSCAFCAQPIYGRHHLKRPLAHVERELSLLKDEYGIKQVRLVDELQMADREAFTDLCRIMDRLGLKWRTHTRADLLLRNKDLLATARDSGLVEMAIGVENPDDGILKLVNKGVTSAQCAEAVQAIKDAGIKSKAYFIVGLPGETWETVENTKRWIEEVKPGKCTLSTFAPFPNCDIWLHPEKYGYRMNHPYDWRLFFMLGYETTRSPFVGETEAMSNEELVKARVMLYEFMIDRGYKDEPPPGWQPACGGVEGVMYDGISPNA